MEDNKVKGYCTKAPEKCNETKKIAWFKFWDNDFADKVELDLNDRELIQENGKWFVVKKKPIYPKTYEECCKVLGYDDRETYCICHTGANERLFDSLYCLKVCRDAYWKIAGEEMGLGKPWEPDLENEELYCIQNYNKQITISRTNTAFNKILIFPTEEMRDVFYKNFKGLIELCKEWL
jgi:hypothetical protein